MKKQLRELLTAFERLSGREQAMVLFLFVAVVGAGLGFSAYFIRRNLENREKRVAAKIEKVREIVALKGDYQQRLAEQNRLAEQVEGNRELRLLSYLEDLSKKAHIELGQASERQSSKTSSSKVVESSAEVLVKNVSLDRLHGFLDAIERGNPLVTVRRLRIRSRFDNPEKLDATIQVGTFKPSESAGSGS